MTKKERDDMTSIEVNSIRICFDEESLRFTLYRKERRKIKRKRTKHVKRGQAFGDMVSSDACFGIEQNCGAVHTKKLD